MGPPGHGPAEALRKRVARLLTKRKAHTRRAHSRRNRDGTISPVKESRVRETEARSNEYRLVRKGNAKYVDYKGRPNRTFEFTCPYCGQSVVYFEDANEGRVVFDFLGKPWPKHRCEGWLRKKRKGKRRRYRRGSRKAHRQAERSFQYEYSKRWNWWKEQKRDFRHQCRKRHPGLGEERLVELAYKQHIDGEGG